MVGCRCIASGAAASCPSTCQISVREQMRLPSICLIVSPTKCYRSISCSPPGHRDDDHRITLRSVVANGRSGSEQDHALFLSYLGLPTLLVHRYLSHAPLQRAYEHRYSCYSDDAMSTVGGVRQLCPRATNLKENEGGAELIQV